MPIRSTYRSNPEYNIVFMGQEIKKILMGCSTNSGAAKLPISEIKSMVNQMISAMNKTGTDESAINNVFYNLELKGSFGDLCSLKNEYDKVKGTGSFERLISKGKFDNFEIFSELEGPDNLIPIFKSVKNIYNKWYKAK
jgi:hypothetical protein